MSEQQQLVDYEADIPVGLVGCDFRRGSSRWRSRLVLEADERAWMSKELRQSGIIDGLAFLETCNRNEWLFSAKNPCWAGEILKAQMIKRWHGMEGKCPHPYVWVADDAVRHVLRVASGLESFVVGERQILSQLNRALELARRESASSVYLNKLGAIGGTIARQVRQQASPSGAVRGIHDVAAGYVADHVKMPATALVIGAGEIGRRLAASLSTVPGLKVLLMNRTIASGQGRVLPLTDLPETAADVILVCTAAPAPVVTAANLPPGSSLLIDLGIPCQIDPKIEKMYEVTRLDLDDLIAEGQGGTISPERLQIASLMVDQGRREYAQFCLQRRFVNVLESTRKNSDEFISTFLPQFVDQLLPEAESLSRENLEARLRGLIRRYTASILESINASIASNEWTKSPAGKGEASAE